MPTKTITIWGKNSSGKTTTAINLACNLSSKNYIVGIISANMYYGEIQSMLNTNIPKEQGLHKALSIKNILINEMYTPTTISKNIFILSLPNRFDCLDNTEISAKDIEKVINQSKNYFDFLIIDGNFELENGLTYIGMEKSDFVLRIYKPSITTCIWHKGTENLITQLSVQDKIINIINNHDKSCDLIDFKNKVDVKFAFELPQIKLATTYENSGNPIYFQNGRQENKYSCVIEKLSNFIISGGDKIE